MRFQNSFFHELDVNTLYDIICLRVAVFVVEQTCYYQDLDGLDQAPQTRHLMQWNHQTLAGYARILAPGTSYPGYASIGRIANPMSHRGKGLGHRLVAEAVALCCEYWPNSPIKISAQAHLQGFYAQHGFVTASEQYLEDGIPHIAMVRQVKQESSVDA